MANPKSYELYPGDGLITTFGFSLPYLQVADLEVYVDGVLQEVVTDYTLSGPNTIEFAAAPANGAVVQIKRNSTKNGSIVDFTRASLTEEDLDLNRLQAFYAIEEALDATIGTIALSPANGQYDADALRLTNVADGVADDDAATIGQLAPYASAAASSAVSAQSSEDDAAASAAASAASASAAEIAAQTLNIPPTAGNALKFIRVTPAATGFEYLNPVAVKTALGLDNTAGMSGLFYMETPPAGWLKANGAAVLRSGYTILDANIYCGDAQNGTALFGFHCTDPLDPFNTRDINGDYLRLPDARGEFFRGWDDGRGVDSGRSFGTFQADELKSHRHALDYNTDLYDGGSSFTRNYVSGSDGERNTTFTGGSETRPRNIALLACIKY